ncbi:SUKH-4 family immunity protein [Nonomuraea sp. NEAU-A123]|uniref:SUKH-4 family immunity protein n=1 Tax=Nonomuraea sp. NEAU-A123 TaxID=2839649 RepID=UPI001BE48E10|nr:SUKH-4 family immunity protein [Nonomuraea sp. NEAU-A123]MBT2228640.1 SUKH-4 family immunity protein [Nonomuraea sp. NEAU-A123]
MHRRHEARDIGLSKEDERLLSHVGLPRDAPLFTADVIGKPRLFDLEEFSANGVLNRVLFLGGPEEDFRARFFLDVREGFIVRMALTTSGSEAEVVNSSLRTFIEFLYRVGSTLRLQEAEAGEPVPRRRPRSRSLSGTWIPTRSESPSAGGR